MDRPDKKLLKALIDVGCSVSDLATVYSVCNTTIYLWLRQHGIQHPRTKLCPKIDTHRLNKLKKLLQKRGGRGVKELTELLGIKKETLYRDFKRLKEQGIEIERVGVSRPTLYRQAKE